MADTMRTPTPLSELLERSPLKVHLGCGEVYLRDWVNLDVVGDLAMFVDSTVDELLTVNLIDHLRLADLPAAVAEWHRVLRPDGRLIVDLGDIRGNAEMLVAAETREELEWALRLTYCHSRDPFDSHH